MKKLWRPLSRVLLLFIFLFFVYTILIVPSGGRARESHYRSICQSNLKQIGLACLLYAQDYDSRLMPISNGQGEGWADLIAPYAKTRSFFQCPKGTAPPAENRSDYFYNARLTSFKLESINLPAQVILIGDGYDNGGTNSNLWELPYDWVTDEDSPAMRHLSFGNYTFADGHVKYVRPKVMSNMADTFNEPRPFTFAPK